MVYTASAPTGQIQRVLLDAAYDIVPHCIHTQTTGRRETRAVKFRHGIKPENIFRPRSLCFFVEL